MENKVVQDVVVAPDENWSAVLTPGQRLRIVDLEGKQAVDFLCYNAGHGIYTVRATKLFTILADTMGGGHDTMNVPVLADGTMGRSAW